MLAAFITTGDLKAFLAGTSFSGIDIDINNGQKAYLTYDEMRHLRDYIVENTHDDNLDSIKKRGIQYWGQTNRLMLNYDIQFRFPFKIKFPNAEWVDRLKLKSNFEKKNPLEQKKDDIITNFTDEEKKKPLE